jgi:SAM-dependent methyltransferase
MNRLTGIRNFIETDRKENFIIEPVQRHDAIRDKILETINTYKPEVIIKAGLGRGQLLAEIARKTDAYISVVEPSYISIKNFLESYGNDDKIKKIKFINGDFHEFPLDYYAADLLICVDYLDFFDSGQSINEFKRALKFGGILFFSTVTLNDNDIEGIYDDLTRMIFPLHNDFYIADDLDTFLNLKEFDSVNNYRLEFKTNLETKLDYFFKIYNSDSKVKALEYIESNKAEFKNLMSMKDNFDIMEPYYIGIFKRRKQT